MVDRNESPLRSVRVVVETLESGGGPLPESPSPSRAPLGAAFVVAAVALIVGTFLLLRPDSDEAVDGSQRTDPTTSTTTSPTTASPSATAPSGDGNELTPATTPSQEPNIDIVQLEEPIVSELVESPRQLSQIASAESGLVALGLDSIADPSRDIVPAAVGADAIIGLELIAALEAQTVPPLLVETRDQGVCGAYEAGPAEFALSDCADFSRLGDLPPPDVRPPETPDCAGIEAGAGGTPGFVILEIGLDGEEPVESVNSLFALGGTVPKFGSLNEGRLAVFDPGNPTIALCDGSGTLRARDAGVVVVDVERNRTIAYPLPGELADQMPDRLRVEILAEVQLFEESTHLISAFEGAVWATNMATGEWTALTNRLDDLGFQTPFSPQFAASESGDRLYRVANESITIFEIGVDPAGNLRTVATTAPIESPTEDGIVSGFGRIMLATDDVMFYTDGVVVWRLALPELSS